MSRPSFETIHRVKMWFCRAKPGTHPVDGLRIDVLIVIVKRKTVSFPFLFPIGEDSAWWILNEVKMFHLK
jgi:hypothetical protein